MTPPPEHPDADDRDSRLTAECRRLLTLVRERCPGLLPPAPLEPGTPAPPVDLEPGEAEALFPLAAMSAAGTNGDNAVVWREGERALLVRPARTRVAFGTGVVAVSLHVECDQVRQATVHVSFVVGDLERPAGLVAVTDGRPRGPAVVVDAWGESLVAFAWHVVLEVLVNVAGEAGRDLDGSRLVPIGFAVQRNRFQVTPMARHGFDRQRG